MWADLLETDFIFSRNWDWSQVGIWWADRSSESWEQSKKNISKMK